MQNFIDDYAVLDDVSIQSASMDELFPPEIAKAVANAERIKIFNVSDETLEQPIVRADRIVFESGAKLRIPESNWPYVVLWADELLFASPQARATIYRDLEWEAQDGSSGAAGANKPTAGRSGRHGRRGDQGGPGGTGKPGASVELPELYIITNKVVVQDGSVPDFVNLKILVPGVDGGTGGAGGRGGNGGAGGPGLRGASGGIGCRRGPGNGGHGGDGGPGGRGGDGGAGGDGGDVVYFGPQAAIDVLQFSGVVNIPGEPGNAGQPGPHGNPGKGGPRGARPGPCGGGRRGRNGSIPSPANLGRGNIGEAGSKGSTTAYIVKKIDDLLPAT